MSDHLKLPFYEKEFERSKKEGRRGFEPRKEKQGFSEIQISNLGKIRDDFNIDKENFMKFFNPNLLFKLKLNQNVDEEGFVKFLERNHIKIISPSPDNKGFWISLAEDENLEEIIRRLKEYGAKGKYTEFNAIESFEPIPPEDKIGEQLKEKPLQDKEETYLDIEIWRMDDERLKKFLGDKNKPGFERFIESNGGKVTDRIITENLCLLRVKVNKTLFDKIIKLREVSRIDRPPKPYITWQILSTPLEELKTGESPPKDATAIAILDSGILSNHPLLEKAVGDEIAVPLRDKIREDRPQDDVGHGTKVAGIALYGDIKRCIEERRFQPEVWILSAKVMFKNEMGEAEYDPEELLEHQLEKAVRYFVKNYPNCKVVNISFGDRYKKMFGNKRQFPLATLIDELAKELNVVFVISAGNHTPERNDLYPDYLIEEKEEVKIIDPASSAYAITVGSISQEFGPSDRNPQELLFSLAQKDYPSPFTCAGPGYKGMIKPELVEEGGNIITSPTDPLKTEDIGGKLVVLNPQWLNDGRLFTVDYGTSLSAPKVAHYLGKIFNHFPEYSPNLIKALLLASAEIPGERPRFLNEIDINDSNPNLLKLLKIYGYGKPNFEVAVSSENNRVLLIAENKIRLNNIHLYYFYLPKEFVEYSGKREISVVLVYNPPIRRNRIDYLGISMELHLFKNSRIEEVVDGYKPILKKGISEEQEDIVPKTLKLKKIDLHPGVTLRKKGLHQKGIKIFSKKPNIDIEKPLVLVLISQDRWVKENDYLQDYAVVVTIKHQANIDLYNRLQQQIRVKIR